MESPWNRPRVPWGSWHGVSPAPQALAASAALLVRWLLREVQGERWRLSLRRGRERPAGSPGLRAKPPALLGQWDWSQGAEGHEGTRCLAGVWGPRYGVAVACSPGDQHGGSHQWGSHPAGTG